ncbi:MAG: GntP family permease [Gemmataceae bacterium]
MTTFDPYPLVLLALGVLTIFVLIIYLRVNAFLALIGAALLVGLLSPRVILVKPKAEPGQTAPAPKAEPQLDLVQAPTQVAVAFGNLMGSIGLVIALATIIGKALMDSGAADRIVRAFARLFGERYAPFALLTSGFVLSVPVFFDTVFFLLVPLAKALRLRTGKDYLLYVMAIGAGGAVTHSLVPPTPGPVGMAANLDVDLGMTILIGLCVGAPMALCGFAYGAWANARWPVPLRQVGEVTLEELEERAHRPDEELPSLFWSLVPIVLPVLLITSYTFFVSLAKKYPDIDTGFQLGDIWVSTRSVLAFIGDKNIALLLSAIVAMVLVAVRLKMSRRELGDFTAKALDEAGMILLITCAGGSFGAMLKAVGVGESIDYLAREGGVSPLVVAWGIAVLFKIAQGSGTVSMITTSDIVKGIIVGRLSAQGLEFNMANVKELLGYHPVYLLMAIGAGSLVGSWMNDSGYWVVCKMSGFTEGETFKSWTATLIVMGLVGLPLVWILTLILPLA